MSEETVTLPSLSAKAEAVICSGDLKNLTDEEKVLWYKMRCHAAGLDYTTEPFQYIILNGKLKLYATKTATEQIAEKRAITLQIVGRESVGDAYVVTCRATDPTGRFTESIGAVSTKGKAGDEFCNMLMKAECVPLDSEILTRRGFIPYYHAIIGEDVLAYDCESDTCQWTPLLDITVHESLPMARLFTDKGQFAVHCTPDHSWAVQKPMYKQCGQKAKGAYSNRQPDRFLIEARNINTSQKIVLAAPIIDDSNSLLTPTEAAVLGWAVTDGTIQKKGNFRRIGICQSKEKYLPTIRDLIHQADTKSYESVTPAKPRTFPMTGRTYQTKKQHWFYLPAQASRDLLNKCSFQTRADLPRIVCSLSRDARIAMLDAMQMAESDDRLNFAQTDSHVLEAFQILCTLEGIALGKPSLIKGGCTVQRAKSTRHVAGSFLNMEPIGNMPAWCPTTQYGTWIMRQGGRVMITGNTKSKRRAVLSLTGLGMLDESEVDDIPSTPRPTPIEPSHSPALPPPPQEETAQKPQSETAASAKACFCEKARNLGYSGHIGQLAVTLLGHKPDKWTAQTWLDATEKTATEWDAALLLLREEADSSAAIQNAAAPVETQTPSEAPLPALKRIERLDRVISGLREHFGAQRLEEGIQKISVLMRRDIFSYAELTTATDIELGKIEKWLADARLNEGAKAA